MRIPSKFRNQITLKRKWYLYILTLFAFIIASYYYRDAYFLQVGVTLLSIAIVYLVMETSNIELKEITEKQIKAFVENIQMVCSELKTVSNGINTLTKVMKEVQEAIGTSELASKEATIKAEAEKRKRKESIKPRLSIRVEVGGFQFWIFDNRHYYLSLANSGCDAIATVAQIGNFVSEAYNIGTRKQIGIDIGRINTFSGISRLNVEIEVRDVDKNLYRGNIQVSLPQSQWISIPLTEM